MGQQGRPVAQGDQAEGQEVVQPDRLLVRATQVEDDPGDELAQQRADRQAADDGPDQVHRHPAPAGGAELVEPEQAQPQHDEREGGAVVQARLAGEGEPQAIPVRRVRHLDVGGEHRVGRRQDRAEEDRGPPRQAEPHHAGDRDQADRHRHRAGGEAHRQFPECVAQADAELQAGREERDDHRDLGEPLQ